MFVSSEYDHPSLRWPLSILGSTCSGHKAALAGGTTMHIDFVLPPADGNIIQGWETYQEKAEGAAMDYGFHIAVTKFDEEVGAQLVPFKCPPPCPCRA